MKERIVIFDKSYELILKDKFGNDLSSFKRYTCDTNEDGEEVATKFSLEIPQKDGYYQSKDNERFYIYKGEGELDLSECVKWDFEKLNVVFLDFYLTQNRHNFAADEVDRASIERFCEFNTKYGESKKIVPPYYEKILTQLVMGI